MLRLVQAASNPRLIDESYDREPGKLAAAQSFLHQAFSEGSKAIVWTSFTENVDWLARLLREHGAVRVHGKLAIEQRNSALRKFVEEPTCQVLVATPGAAKEGLTLTVANYALFYDRSFSLDDYLQAQDRIHRISQDRPCLIVNLLGRGTIDEWVDQLLSAKQLAAQLLQGDIDQHEYREKATYEFSRIFGEVLGIDAGRE
jgi:SNF2 family DNA or RNA helicase